MATYKQIGYGSRGNEVNDLQRRLNQSGYNIAVDGKFGPETQNAVKQYQQKMGLKVDGIVGNNTWGKLLNNNVTNKVTNVIADGGTGGSTNTNATTPKDYGSFSYKDYQESDTVKEAANALGSLKAPDAYQSQWNDQIQATIDKILNREKFSYDLNGDALYQQYADKFQQQGKMAMMDTMGQAAAMTGGYGNSYASTAGNQAYQAHLSELNDIVPELYQMAYDKYRNEGQDLVDQYSLLAAQDQQDYGKHRDQVSDYYTDRGYLTDRYDSERNFDYGKYADDRNFDYGKFSDDRNLAYQQDRDIAADEKWQKEFGLALEKWNAEQNAGSGSNGGGGGNGGNGNNGGNNNNGGGNNEQVAASGVPDDIVNKVKNYTTKQGQADFIAKQVNSGKITEDQAMDLLDAHGVSELKDRSWEVVDDGGVNWLWGVDNNAVVRDENGKEYTLKQLQKELEKTMTSKEAKAYIKKLQDRLGI